MANAKKGNRVAIQIKAAPERIQRWDNAARRLGMRRAEFARHCLDSYCDMLDSQAETESRAAMLARHNLTP